MLHPTLIDKQSPYLGEGCALCHEPLAPGDEVIICPEDAAHHHTYCWQANNNQCTAYGCQGTGDIETRPTLPPTPNDPIVAHIPALTPTPAETAVVAPSPIATNCLLISIAIAILLIAIGCYGLWAIADYILLEVLGWPYRQPLLSAILIGYF